MRYTDTDEDFGNEGPVAAGDEGVDTPLGFDFGFAIPPPADPQDPGWQDRVASTIRPCDELSHTGAGYNQAPDYDGFWMDRDYGHLLVSGSISGRQVTAAGRCHRRHYAAVPRRATPTQGPTPSRSRRRIRSPVLAISLSHPRR